MYIYIYILDIWLRPHAPIILHRLGFQEGAIGGLTKDHRNYQAFFKGARLLWEGSWGTFPRPMVPVRKARLQLQIAGSQGPVNPSCTQTGPTKRRPQ